MSRDLASSSADDFYVPMEESSVSEEAVGVAEAADVTAGGHHEIVLSGKGTFEMRMSRLSD